MTASPLTRYLEQLDTTARTASAAEDAFRRETAKRVRELEGERAFAFRRLNLMRAIAVAVSGAKDVEEATANGSAAFLRELEWSGASESQKEVLKRFQPVMMALWEAGAEDADASRIEEINEELAAFEKWFAETRNTQFMKLLEHEVVELPLVEVS